MGGYTNTLNWPSFDKTDEVVKSFHAGLFFSRAGKDGIFFPVILAGYVAVCFLGKEPAIVCADCVDWTM